MKIGIISDTHDNLDRTKEAVNVFNQERVSLVIHAGDFIAPFILVKVLKNLKAPLIGVFGNNDGEKEGLKKSIEGWGKIHPSPYEFKWKERKILISHEISSLKGKDLSLFSLVVLGHTHQPEVKKEKKTLIINPGECGGWLYGKSTVGIIDLEKNSARIINLRETFPKTP